MRWIHFALLATAVALVTTAAPVLAQSDPFDMSEFKQKLFDWPFDETEFWVEEDGGQIYQYTRLSDDRDDVIDTLKQMQKDQEELGNGYRIMGFSYNSSLDRWQVTLSQKQLFLIATVLPDEDNGGTMVSIASDPIPVVSGYFKRPLYPYRLLGGKTVKAVILQPGEY